MNKTEIEEKENNIIHHWMNFRGADFRHAETEFSSFKYRIYDEFLFIDIETRDLDKLNLYINIFKDFRRRAAYSIDKVSPDEKKILEKMIKLADEQLDLLKQEKTKRNDIVERDEDRKFERRKFRWELIGIILSILIGLTALFTSIFY